MHGCWKVLLLYICCKLSLLFYGFCKHCCTATASCHCAAPLIEIFHSATASTASAIELLRFSCATHLLYTATSVWRLRSMFSCTAVLPFYFTTWQLQGVTFVSDCRKFSVQDIITTSLFAAQVTVLDNCYKLWFLSSKLSLLIMAAGNFDPPPNSTVGYSDAENSLFTDNFRSSI